MSALTVENLTLRFGGLKALDNLSLRVRDGERLVLFGPNGAGKTTLFNVITGLLRHTAGTVKLYDHDLTTLSVRRRIALGMGRTFQITTLFPRMTVLESAMLAMQAREPSRFTMYRSLMSYKKIRQRSMDLLNDWGLAHKAEIETRRLSYGEQRQVELVLALACRPRFLLLDEPAAGLSAVETAAIETMIGRFSREITVMLIEHDVDMALRIADRVLVLQQGRVVVEGTPDAIRGDPLVAQIYFGADGV
jgi:branched-chain amino acid transport system ATP-binding protein